MSEEMRSFKSLEEKIHDIIVSCTGRLTEMAAAINQHPENSAERQLAAEEYSNYRNEQCSRVESLINQRQFYIHPSKWLDDVKIIHEYSGMDKVLAWSGNRHVRANDIFLFYYTKNGPKTNLEFISEDEIRSDYPPLVSDLILNHPASIYAMCRCISNAFLIKTDPNYPWRVFVSEFVFFNNPLPIESLPEQKSVLFMGGLFSPRRFPIHGNLLAETKRKLIESNPDLTKSYLQFSNFWNDKFPRSDDPEWLKKISDVSERAFYDEDMVKEYFILPLLGNILENDYNVDPEFAIKHNGKLGSIDYVITRGKIIIPVEAKFDIDHQVDKRYFDQIARYIAAVRSDFGFLIDRNVVYVIGKDNEIRLVVKREGLSKKNLSDLRQIISRAKNIPAE